MKNFVIRLSMGVATATVLTFTSQAYALPLLGQEPDASKIVDTGNGLEWVYAAPCAGDGIDPQGEIFCGVGVQLHHDFRFATAEEWLDSFGDRSGLISAFNLDNFDPAMCAAREFSLHREHCDPEDVVVNGAVWHAPVGIADAQYVDYYRAETFLVRGTQIPVPTTLALFGLGLIGLGWKRRQA